MSKDEQYKSFTKEIMNSVTRISNLSDQLQNTITINRDWKAKVEAYYK